MIINPSVFLGWNRLFKGAVNHMALSASAVHGAGQVTSDIRLALSDEGMHWFPQEVRGDINAFVRSSGGPGAFEIIGLLRFAGAWWAYGAIWKSSGQSEGALFRSEHGLEWNRVLTGFEAVGAVPSYRHFRYGDAGANALALLKETGEVVYTLDGTTWAMRTDVVGYSGPSGPTLAARGMTITSSGIAVVGTTSDTSGFRLKTAATLGGAFTDRGAPWGQKNVSVVARGNIALGISIHSPTLGAVRSAFAPENNIGQAWTNAGLADGVYVDRAFYALGRWYAGSSEGWRTSVGAAGVAGVGGWVPVSPPWEGATLLNSGYERNGQAFAHFGLGQVAVSEDGEDWSIVESGLEPVRYLAAVA